MTITCSCGAHLDWTSLELVGLQDIPEHDGNPAYALEMRNCSSCGSTRCRDVPRPTYAVVRDWTNTGAPTAHPCHPVAGRVVSRHRSRTAAHRALHRAQRRVLDLPASWRPDMIVCAVLEQDASGFVRGVTT